MEGEAGGIEQEQGNYVLLLSPSIRRDPVLGDWFEEVILKKGYQNEGQRGEEKRKKEQTNYVGRREGRAPGESRCSFGYGGADRRKKIAILATGGSKKRSLYVYPGHLVLLELVHFSWAFLRAAHLNFLRPN